MQDTQIAIFELLAESEANTLLRVLEYFALIGATPTSVWASRNEDSTQSISITVEGLNEQRAYIIAGKLGQIFTVNSSSYSLRSGTELQSKPRKCA